MVRDASGWLVQGGTMRRGTSLAPLSLSAIQIRFTHTIFLFAPRTTHATRSLSARLFARRFVPLVLTCTDGDLGLWLLLAALVAQVGVGRRLLAEGLIYGVSHAHEDFDDNGHYFAFAQTLADASRFVNCLLFLYLLALL